MCCILPILQAETNNNSGSLLTVVCYRRLKEPLAFLADFRLLDQIRVCVTVSRIIFMQCRSLPTSQHQINYFHLIGFDERIVIVTNLFSFQQIQVNASELKCEVSIMTPLCAAADEEGGELLRQMTSRRRRASRRWRC